MNTFTGRLRLTLKWHEFMTGGAIPGTKASDILKIMSRNSSGYKDKHNYSSPTMLNGYFGSKL